MVLIVMKMKSQKKETNVQGVVSEMIQRLSRKRKEPRDVVPRGMNERRVN